MWRLKFHFQRTFVFMLLRKRSTFERKKGKRNQRQQSKHVAHRRSERMNKIDESIDKKHQLKTVVRESQASFQIDIGQFVSVSYFHAIRQKLYACFAILTVKDTISISCDCFIMRYDRSIYSNMKQNTDWLLSPLTIKIDRLSLFFLDNCMCVLLFDLYQLSWMRRITLCTDCY